MVVPLPVLGHEAVDGHRLADTRGVAIEPERLLGRTPGHRHLVAPHHEAHAVAVGLPDDGPSVRRPGHRQEAHLAASPVAVPMMCQEEPLALGILQVAPLVGLVPLTLRVAEPSALAVGAHGTVGTLHGDVPSAVAVLAEQVVVLAAPLVELVGLAAIALVDEHLAAQVHGLAVGREPEHIGLVAVGEMGGHEIILAVIVKQRTTVVPSAADVHFGQGSPGTLYPLGRGHEHALVGTAEVHVELAVVPADGARPDATRIAVHHPPGLRVADLRYVGHGVAVNPPVDHVRGAQDDHARLKLERAADGIVVAVVLYAVDVTVVAGDDRVEIGTGRLLAPGLPIAPNGGGERQLGICTETHANAQKKS